MPITLTNSTFTLSVLKINNTNIDIIQATIEKKIKNTPAFLKNSPIVININKINYKNNWNKIYKTIINTGLNIIGVCCCNDNILKEIIVKSGVPLINQNVKHNYTFNISTTKEDKQKINNTKIINTPIRSGQQIYARNSDIIIINDVSSGAEIIADGNVHIYGTIRGRILAGASGNNNCQIFCKKLSPELISIGGQYWLHDQIPIKFKNKAARIYIKNNMLTIQPL